MTEDDSQGSHPQSRILAQGVLYSVQSGIPAIRYLISCTCLRGSKCDAMVILLRAGGGTVAAAATR